MEDSNCVMENADDYEFEWPFETVMFQLMSAQLFLFGEYMARIISRKFALLLNSFKQRKGRDFRCKYLFQKSSSEHFNKVLKLFFRRFKKYEYV